MNRYSWHTTTEKDSGGWYKCTAIVVFPGKTVKFNTYPFYKPNLKGGHRHKKYFTKIFFANIQLNPDELGKILAKSRKR